MVKKRLSILMVAVFTGVALLIVALYYFPPWGEEEAETPSFQQNRVVLPREVDEEGDFVPGDAGPDEQAGLKLPMSSGEVLAALLTTDLDGDFQDEQLLVYQNAAGSGPLYLGYIAYDDGARSYQRLWTTAVPAEDDDSVRSESVSLSTLDLLGDHSVCAIITGMTARGEQALTAFLIDPISREPPRLLVDLQVDGSIILRETARSEAYQLGVTGGGSFPLVAYCRDPDSDNIMDQVEITYTYDPAAGRYEESGRVKVPGSQIEQRRAREILGSRKNFEAFIAGLWYYVSPQGTLDSQQYIYFDPPGDGGEAGEIIFYGDETQQVFTWLSASSTSYGIYVSTQNISITTLKRFVDVQLESLDSVRVKVVEDVRLNIGGTTAWDGSYRKEVVSTAAVAEALPGEAHVDALYSGGLGALRLAADGSYELTLAGQTLPGKYAFLSIDGRRILELRPTGGSRETYLVEAAPTGMTLIKIRLGIQGIEELNESAIFMTLEDT